MGDDTRAGADAEMGDDVGADQDLSRCGGFMDAVFAIAITLPIVQITPPRVGPGEDLGSAYRAQIPELAAYVLGFVVIGLFWNYSHFSSRLLRRTDHVFTLLTILYLACVSLTPFSARPYVEHALDPANARVAAALYGCILASPTVVWFARWCWGITHGLYDGTLSDRYVRALTVRYAAVMAVALLGVAQLLLGYSATGMATVALAILSLLLPPPEPEPAKPGR